MSDSSNSKYWCTCLAPYGQEVENHRLTNDWQVLQLQIGAEIVEQDSRLPGLWEHKNENLHAALAAT